MDEPLLIVEEEEEYSPIARLIELGRQKSYVTLDDILHFFPEAEQDVEQLEEAFAALLSAGIPFVEDATTTEPSEDELALPDEPAEPEPELDIDDYLANIDTDDWFAANFSFHLVHAKAFDTARSGVDVAGSK